MLTCRKAVVLAAFILTAVFLLHAATSSSSTHSKYSSPTSFKDAPKIRPTHKSTTRLSPGSDDAHAAKPTAGAAVGQGRPYPPPRQVPGPAGRKAGTAKQQPLSDTVVTKSLRDQLAYQFEYDRGGKFPAYIWQTWKHSPSEGAFEEEFREFEASWTELHPGFVHEVVTDRNAIYLLRHLYASVPDVLEAYEALPMAVVKADFFRYLILLARGGIYTDIDTEAIKSATEWVPEHIPRASIGLVVGVEADPDREDWHEWYSRRLQLCQWTIQAKAGHPVLRNIVAAITENTLALKKKGSGTIKADEAFRKQIIEFTGPAIWTDTIFSYLNDPTYFNTADSGRNITWREFTHMEEARKAGDIIVLPITSFSPGVAAMGAKEPDDPMAFVRHEFSGTWKPESEQVKPVVEIPEKASDSSS